MTDKPAFTPGLQLCRAFYEEAVRPILSAHFSGLSYSVGRLGRGSDVFGFDTPESMDHDWGPQLALFLEEEDAERLGEPITRTLAAELPRDISGFPTHFGASALIEGETQLQPRPDGPIDHWVKIWTVADFFSSYLGFDPRGPIAAADWLSLFPQRLAEVTCGAIFHDGLGQLDSLRQKLAWYPRDLWRYVLACQWRRVDRQHVYMGRAGDVGDELGSRLVAARQVDELMQLCFLLEKTYAPYYKWFGSAFARLDCAGELRPIFERVWAAADWREREAHLIAAYRAAAERQNRLELAPPVEPAVRYLRERPYQHFNSHEFYQSLYDSIEDDAVKALPGYLGALGQFADSIEIYERLEWSRALGRIYEE